MNRRGFLRRAAGAAGVALFPAATIAKMLERAPVLALEDYAYEIHVYYCDLLCTRPGWNGLITSVVVPADA